MTTTTSMLPGLAQPICLRQPALRPLCVRAAGTRAILSAMARRVPVDLILPNGELLGGCDIVEEMFESGELAEALGVEQPAEAKVSEAAPPAQSPPLQIE